MLLKATVVSICPFWVAVEMDQMSASSWQPVSEKTVAAVSGTVISSVDRMIENERESESVEADFQVLRSRQANTSVRLDLFSAAGEATVQEPIEQLRLRPAAREVVGNVLDLGMVVVELAADGSICARFRDGSGPASRLAEKATHAFPVTAHLRPLTELLPPGGEGGRLRPPAPNLPSSSSELLPRSCRARFREADTTRSLSLFQSLSPSRSRSRSRYGTSKPRADPEAGPRYGLLPGPGVEDGVALDGGPQPLSRSRSRSHPASTEARGGHKRSRFEGVPDKGGGLRYRGGCGGSRGIG